MTNAITASQPTKTAINIEQWSKEGVDLATNHRNLMWEIAEWMQFGVIEFGNTAEQIALQTFSKSKTDIRKAMDVSKRFSPEKRRPGLTFNHHALVMPLGDDEADNVLDYAVENGSTLSQTKKAVATIRESTGGDVYAQMTAISYDELLDDWNGKMVRLFNRAPSQEARDQFIELATTFENRLILQ